VDLLPLARVRIASSYTMYEFALCGLLA
jgi:hypothetical protein